MLTPPIPVVLPLLMAAVLAALNHRISSRLASLLSILTALAVAGVCAALLVSVRAHPIVYWFGGWPPRNGAAIGIAFVIDTAGAALALLASILAAAALVFSSRYFDTVGNIYHVLMLVFLAAMCGFCLTGDLFNLFVFFELMSASAFALCGYKSEEPGPLQGALNFAVTNTAGAFLALTGIALLYGRTGALNLAQIGRALEGRTGGLVVTAFVFITTGFLVKAAAVPFHFWLADAHAVAPTPVCVLFSGVMVELGLYAVVRIYWAVFSAALAPHAASVRSILVGMGVITALTGAVMCLSQRHIKRMLAFSTVSHLGIMLIGFGLLAPVALAGTAIYVLGHAMVKGALFLCAGILLHRTRSVDEIDLFGHGRSFPGVAAIWFLGGLGLAGLPPFATSIGHSLLDEGARTLGYEWAGWVGSIAAAMTAAAVFSAGGRVFVGWGPAAVLFPGGHTPKEEPETQGNRRRTPAVMWIPAAALVALGLSIGLLPHLRTSAVRSAAAIENRAAYADRVLDSDARAISTPPEPVAAFAGIIRGCIVAIAALALAALILFGERFRRVLSRTKILHAGIFRLRRLHSGIVPDYVTWLTVGVAVMGAFSALLLN
jgi:multicomponent Na+:H+ antiporter subunit D